MYKFKKNIYILTFLIFLLFLISTLSHNPSIQNLDNRIQNNEIQELLNLKSSTVEFAWKSNGLVICNETGDQGGIESISDENGGAILVWYDYREGNSDIYAQRIDSDGNQLWDPNGTLVCNSDGDQYRARICEDGDGGVIITWEDHRTGNYGIYAQRINSSGDVLWESNGTIISNYPTTQEVPSICSDGSGGAIISWDRRIATGNEDIFAQKINASGDTQWTPNGTVICSLSGYQIQPVMCSDGEGGAIIAWEDRRSDYDVYMQRINSSGDAEWTTNGVWIGDTTNGIYPDIISDGFGGAIISWRTYGNSNYDFYAERIDSSGTALWGPGGIAVAAEQGINNNQYYGKICSDGAGGAIFVYVDNPQAASDDDDLYAQKVDALGTIMWNSGGVPICVAAEDQRLQSIAYDGVGGAQIVWMDERDISSTSTDIYIQSINSSGDIQWQSNGEVVIQYSDAQRNPKIVSDREGSFYISWIDYRDGNYDIYAQCLKNEPPIVNNPHDIDTDMDGTERINWTIIDDGHSGYYRVIANNSLGNYYVWQDWTLWYNNTNLNTPINLTAPGNYNYSIEYYDYYRKYGEIDTVLVNISNNNPIVNQLSPIITYLNGTETIDWVITDDCPSGEYRVWANNSVGNNYIWRDWTTWNNGSALSVPINRSDVGNFNYTIEYKDLYNLYGKNSSVIITIADAIPTISVQNTFITSIYASNNISCTIYDDETSGFYRVIANNSLGNYYIWQDWKTWNSGFENKIEINRTIMGEYNYTIEFFDNNNQFGTPKSIRVFIVNDPPNCSEVADFETSIYSSDTIDWIIYDDGPTGYYRVLANNSLGNYYVWQDWTVWTDNTNLQIPINRTTFGLFNYSIEYYDEQSEYGVLKDIIINLTQYKPTINHLADFSTSIYSSDAIDWIINDDGPTGYYRVIVNNSLGNYYVWQDWMVWTDNTNLHIPINRTTLGSFNYTIEFYDEFLEYGEVSNIIITIIQNIPTINSLADFSTSIYSSDAIDWIINDDGPTGYYRVIANNSLGNYYVCQDWTVWTNNINLQIPINRTTLGSFNYSIEFYDEFGVYGDITDILINLINLAPSVNTVDSIETQLSGSETIDWIITDDGPNGYYRVLVNNSLGEPQVWIGWTNWNEGDNLQIEIDRRETGMFVYTIEFYDEFGVYGDSKSIIVNISESNEETPRISFGFIYLIFSIITIFAIVLVINQKHNF